MELWSRSVWMVEHTKCLFLTGDDFCTPCPAVFVSVNYKAIFFLILHELLSDGHQKQPVNTTLT